MKIGDIVSRISHDNDINFIIINIDGNVAYLKGRDIRLYADAYLDDLVLSDKEDDFRPTLDDEMLDRDEYFYLPGKILHIDGDIDYLNKSLNFYKSCNVLAVGKQISEKDMPSSIEKLLNETKPDILVLTGHDVYYDKKGDENNINNYKNSKFFRDAILKAREYEKSHEKLVIIAGACQSDYEDLIRSGANFASSPKRVNIHALDPAVIAVNVSLTEKDEKINIKELLNKTKYGKNGIGGIMGTGMMYIGYPRS